MSSTNDQNNTPGLAASHAQYVKGQAVDAVGSITGSREWKESGHEQKEQAVANMKAASEGRDPMQSGYGKAEEVAGKVTGCEGMEKEGAASVAGKRQ